MEHDISVAIIAAAGIAIVCILAAINDLLQR
jgi:hypothetical protein